MTTKFGIEIEFKGMTSDTWDIQERFRAVGFAASSEGYNHVTRSYWKLVRDGSVYDGAELVSPPLPFDASGLAEVDNAFRALNACNAFADDQCGTHIHVDLTWLRAYTRNIQLAYFEFITAAFQAHEPHFDMLVKGTRVNGYYCRSTIGKTATDLRNERYHKLNLCSFAQHGTVEFRQLQGCMNAKAVKAWITLCVTFANNCRKRFEANLGARAIAPLAA